MPSAPSTSSRRQPAASQSASGDPSSSSANALRRPSTLASEDVSLFTCLSAYSDALDALPLDLTRSFSDLRELDAVLGPHITSLISRLNGLNEIVRDVDGSYAAQGITSGQRLLLLKECAEEARAYRMGGEDKIRVALNTCETIMSHTEYIDAILDNLTSHPELREIFETERRPHVAGELSDGTPITVASANAAIMAAGGSGIFANPATEAGGRFGVGGGIGGVGLTTFNGMEVDKTTAGGSAVGSSKKKKVAAGGADKDTPGKAPSSAAASGVKSAAAASGSSKKRKASGAPGNGKDDDDSGTPSKKTSTPTTSRKKGSAAAAAAAALARDSPGPSSASRSNSRGGIGGGADDEPPSRGTSSRGHVASALAQSASAARSSRAGSEAQRRDDLKDDDDGSSSRAGSVVAVPSGTRSRPARGGPARGGTAMNATGSSLRRGHAADDDQDGYGGEDGYDEDDRGGADEESGAVAPSYPAAASTGRRGGGKNALERTASSSSLALGSHAGLQNDEALSPAGDGAGGVPLGGSGPGSVGGDEADERRYCFCNNVSYGDMIGCDDDACEREWFHLGCVGLTKPPSGTWYCDDCLDRRAAKASKSKSKSNSSGAGAGGSASKSRLARTSGTHGGGGIDLATTGGASGNNVATGGGGRSGGSAGTGGGKSLRR
ncbi:hypothetical protein BCV69DRAFT_284865 [Microstroma glucosiphilum]|uniref:Chromatin modification-related protein n=1 Tax=Pseudomicrostroma glucosiphilum TaxID=1684307 RepID=A0A316U251_9BASI|nr:hypothetical protein BCV69DRAFT_284865 [Pseudomicrostroma glucosiphilum]PWN18561.1 hypothetical protein BCV69DRAFT_284865 [Pseudomicrostroma glucosiphilum]